MVLRKFCMRLKQEDLSLPPTLVEITWLHGYMVEVAGALTACRALLR